MTKKQAKTAPFYSPSLVKIGLTTSEAKCYSCLFLSGSQTASSLADHINVLPNAIYRLMDSLKDKGFIVQLDTQPTKYQAVPPSVAIENYSQRQANQTEQVKAEVVAQLTPKQPPTNPTKIDILTGKNELFTQAAKYIQRSQTEVLIISIGEPVPEAITLANRDAIAKNVNIKLIVHKYDSDNQNLLSSWLKMGLEVRHYKDWGYHLSVFDQKIAIISTNNPYNTEERISLVIHNPNLAHALADYFYNLWNKSLPISTY